LTDLSHIINQCLKGDRIAQKELFNRYKGILFGICRRYIKRYDVAEDIFTDGMVKIYSKMVDFNGDGSFEGWMKRIMVNECLMYLRKKDVLAHNIDLEFVHIAEFPNVEAKLDNELIHDAIKELPDGYRTVLNLYIVEGYKHREIAELLGISINTSKSQLILARKKLQLILKKKLDINAA
jgi:RNA polymerase sigma-70 factor (ECF subfamily)